MKGARSVTVLLLLVIASVSWLWWDTGVKFGEMRAAQTVANKQAAANKQVAADAITRIDANQQTLDLSLKTFRSRDKAMTDLIAEVKESNARVQVLTEMIEKLIGANDGTLCKCGDSSKCGRPNR